MLAWMGGARKRKHQDVVKEAKRQRKTEREERGPICTIDPLGGIGQHGGSERLSEPPPLSSALWGITQPSSGGWVGDCLIDFGLSDY